MDYNARMYSPSLGRFIQPDTIVPGMGNSQALNRYSYVMNRPVNFSDPTGHRPCGDEEAINCDGNPKNAKIYNSRGLLINSNGMVTLSNLDLPVIWGMGQAGSIVNSGITSLWPTIPPFNVTIPTLSPIGIYGNDPSFYLLPFALRITTQPSLTFNNGSPITIGPGRPAGGFTDRQGNIANRFTLNSDMSSSFGVFTFNEVNDAFTQSTGASIPTWLAPQELAVTLTSSSSINIPNTNLSVNMNIPVTVSMRYNPASTGLVAGGTILGAYVAVQSNPATSQAVSQICRAFSFAC